MLLINNIQLILNVFQSSTVVEVQVELVKSVRHQFSASHILEVYGGSLNQFVKKHMHDTLSLYGAGKHLGKSEASRVLRYLIIENFLEEDVKKIEVYGSVSSELKVNETKA